MFSATMATGQETEDLAQLLLDSGNTAEEISTPASNRIPDQQASTSAEVQQGDSSEGPDSLRCA